MQLSHFSEEDTAIGEAIIEAIDDNGYLTADIDDIIESVRLPETGIAFCSQDLCYERLYR